MPRIIARAMMLLLMPPPAYFESRHENSSELSNIRPQWQHRCFVIVSNVIYGHRTHGLSDSKILDRTRRE